MSYFISNLFSGDYWASNFFHGAGSTAVAPTTPLDEIIGRHGHGGIYRGLSHNFIELFGGKPVELLIFEPNANTYRDGFYYNTRENRLFKKLKAGNLYVWKEVSES